jgi:putative ABC transport system permease protein
MYKNYLKTAWRNLRKNKVYSTINILSLAIGLAACIIILLFVNYERSFDTFHTKNIYRLNEVQKFPGMVSSQKVALSMFPMGPTLVREFPEIKNFTRINWDEKVRVEYNEKQVFLPSSFNVDSTFLQIFDFEMTKGNRQTALQKPNSAVLTESAAKKIFGYEEAVGKTLKIYAGDTMNFMVTGCSKICSKIHNCSSTCCCHSIFYDLSMMNRWGVTG